MPYNTYKYFVSFQTDCRHLEKVLVVDNQKGMGLVGNIIELHKHDSCNRKDSYDVLTKSYKNSRACLENTLTKATNVKKFVLI